MKLLATVRLILVAAPAITACVAFEPEGGHDTAESVATMEEPLGESACSTVGGYTYSGSSNNGKTQIMPADPACGATHTGGTTPTNSYTNAGCSNQYVSEVTNTYNRTFTPYVYWADTAPTTQAACETSWRYMTVWMRNFVYPVGYVWQKHNNQDYSSRGQWVTYGGVGYCRFPDFGPGEVTAGAGTSAVRVVGASHGFLFIKTKHSAGLRHGPPPC